MSARRGIVAMLVPIAVFAFAAPTGAQSDGTGTGEIGGGAPTVSVGLQVYAPGSGGTTAFGPHDTSAPRPVRYEAIPNHSPPPGLDNLCNASAPPTITFGWWYTVNTIDNATGQVVATQEMCVPFPTADMTGPPPPPALPTPPTIAEIWNAIGIPGPGIGVDPAGEGVVGLETRLWSGGPTDLGVGVGLNGYTVTGAAHLVAYRFDSGDGATIVASGAGSSGAPAATHEYDVKNLYTLGVASVWEANVTMTGPGFTAPLPITIGTAVVTSTRDYRVVEVRSVLTG